MNKSSFVKLALCKNQYFKMPLVGKSMEPTLYEGDTITLIPADTIDIGDIVLFEANDTLVLHRVYDVYRNWIVTKGDNHEFCDDPIDRSIILAKSDYSFGYEKKCVPQQKSRFIFNIHNASNIDNGSINDILGSTDIELTYINALSNTSLNIGILPMANDTLSDTVHSLYKTECFQVVLHFNVMVSNKEKLGYIEMSKFDYIARPGQRITSSLLTPSQSVSMCLGILYGIGELK